MTYNICSCYYPEVKSITYIISIVKDISMASYYIIIKNIANYILYFLALCKLLSIFTAKFRQ